MTRSRWWLKVLVCCLEAHGSSRASYLERSAQEILAMAWFSRKVSVTLIDDASGTVVASSNMAPGDLPDSFAIDTTLHLGEDDWSVTHAEPQTKAEFAKSGKLTLRLRKIELMDPKTISFSQLDITERFDDNESLHADEWITTTPLNARIDDLTSSGLPSRDADSEEVYRVACTLSELRESIPIPGDGVYCPICHIANVDLTKLRTPCPTCGRGLLKFGWT